MAITQDSLIQWQAVEASEDLKILRDVLDNLGDEELVCDLEAFLRELRRNAEVRQVLGFDPLLGSDAVPPSHVRQSGQANQRRPCGVGQARPTAYDG